MHHDFAILEQVCYHKLKPPKVFCMCSFLPLPTFKSKAFGKDPLESDIDERVNSDTKSEEDEPALDLYDLTPKQGDKAGIVQ